MALNEKQRRFCDEFLANGGNATQAYKKAYNVKSDEVAKVNGCRLLTNANVQEYIDEHSASIEEHNAKIATAEELQEFVTSVIRGDLQEIVVSASGKKVEAPAGVKDRLKAVDMMARMKGMYRDKVDVSIAPIVLAGYEDVTD